MKRPENREWLVLGADRAGFRLKVDHGMLSAYSLMSSAITHLLNAPAISLTPSGTMMRGRTSVFWHLRKVLGVCQRLLIYVCGSILEYQLRVLRSDGIGA